MGGSIKDIYVHSCFIGGQATHTVWTDHTPSWLYYIASSVPLCIEELLVMNIMILLGGMCHSIPHEANESKQHERKRSEIKYNVGGL